MHMAGGARDSPWAAVECMCPAAEPSQVELTLASSCSPARSQFSASKQVVQLEGDTLGHCTRYSHWDRLCALPGQQGSRAAQGMGGHQMALQGAP